MMRKNVIAQSLEVIRTLTNGIDPTTGEKHAANSPYQNLQTIQALNTAIKSLEGRPKRIPKALRTKSPVYASKPWDHIEEQKLIRNFECGKSFEELAIKHGRTELGIRARLVKLGKLKSRY